MAPCTGTSPLSTSGEEATDIAWPPCDDSTSAQANCGEAQVGGHRVRRPGVSGLRDISVASALSNPQGK